MFKHLLSQSKITLYGFDQDSEQINSDLSGNICSNGNRLSKITLYGSDQDSEWINSDLSVQKKTDYLRPLFPKRSIQIYLVTFVLKKTDYLRSLFIDLTKILNRSIQIYLVTFVTVPDKRDHFRQYFKIELFVLKCRVALEQ